MLKRNELNRDQTEGFVAIWREIMPVLSPSAGPGPPISQRKTKGSTCGSCSGNDAFGRERVCHPAGSLLFAAPDSAAVNTRPITPSFRHASSAIHGNADPIFADDNPVANSSRHETPEVGG